MFNYYGTPHPINRNGPIDISAALETITTDADRHISTEPHLCIKCDEPLPHTIAHCIITHVAPCVSTRPNGGK